MSLEPKTGLTYWPPGALQPDLLFNALLQWMAVWAQAAVIDVRDSPPSTPANGDMHLVADGGGAFAGHDGEVAYRFDDGVSAAWLFYAPAEGYEFLNLANGLRYRFDGSAWAAVEDGGVRNRFVNVALSDLSTALTAATGVAQWFAPEAGTIVAVWIGVLGQSSSGIVRVDLNKVGSSILTTRPAIDAGEDTSLTGTASVIASGGMAKGDRFTFDIDEAGTDAIGLQAVIEYTPA